MNSSNLLLTESASPLVIAEVSQNHDGSLGQAHAFIDAVSDTGADAIKFQTHIAEEESSHDEPFRVAFSYQDKSRYDYWKRMEFTPEQWSELKRHAEQKDLIFLSSPFSLKALEILDAIGTRAWKFGSGEVFNQPLLAAAVNTGKPIILSTGLSSESDIDQQVAFVQNHGNELLLMQCTTAYPTKPEEIGLNRISEMQKRYGCPVGLSDHSATIYPSLAAITLGASAIEVHVTMDRRMFGPDVAASVTLEELTSIVQGARYISKMKSVPVSRADLTDDAQKLRKVFSKSVYSRGAIAKGEILGKENICLKKPGGGISAMDYDKVIGRYAEKDIDADSRIGWEDISQ